jgi:hypothetical protein
LNGHWALFGCGIVAKLFRDFFRSVPKYIDASALTLSSAMRAIMRQHHSGDNHHGFAYNHKRWLWPDSMVKYHCDW